jgi:hypothetical protein
MVEMTAAMVEVTAAMVEVTAAMVEMTTVAGAIKHGRQAPWKETRAWATGDQLRVGLVSW